MAPVNGPVLVSAGPGTGKTRVLTERIRHLISEHGIPSESILALTFTNRAAGELGNRLRDVAEGSTVYAGTFHRFCLSVLRKHTEAAGLDPHFAVADSGLQRTILYRTIPNLSADEPNLLNTQRHLESIRRRDREPDAALGRGDQEMLDAYREQMRIGKLVDFDDLLTRTLDLFMTRRDVLNTYQDQYRYVLVDEFQDTDRTQYELLKQLALPAGRLFVVTDSRQTIYAWRSADPENFNRLHHDFPGLVGPIALTQNYRSGRAIIDAAAALAEPQADERSAVGISGSLGSVRVRRFPTHRIEGRFILDDIRHQLKSGLVAPSDVAVLYPQHAVGDELERIFMEGHLPAVLAHQRGTFQQPIVLRCLTLLRYALSSDSDPGFEDFLRRELDAIDHGLYPAIRAFQRDHAVATFKQAAFDFVEEAPEEARREVQRVAGLAGSAASALQHGSRLPLSSLVSDLLDQLHAEDQPTVRGILDLIGDPKEDNNACRIAAGLATVIAAKGRINVVGNDEALGNLIARLLHRALHQTGVDVCIAQRTDRLEVTPASAVISLDHGSNELTPFLALPSVGAGPVLTTLKACQLLVTHPGNDLQDYVAFDLETTDLNIGRAEVIEIGAVRVRNGAVVGRFHTFVCPRGDVSPGATETHGLTRDQLVDAPPFVEAGARFSAFVGNDILIAHNGYGYDFRVLNREFYRHELPKLPNAKLDTLPMSRSYFSDSRHTIDALCERFGIRVGERSHRALDDARLLYQVFESIRTERAARARKSALEHLVDTVALALLYTPRERWSNEAEAFFNLGGVRLLSPANTEITDLCRRMGRLRPERIVSRIHTILREPPSATQLASLAPEQMQRLRNLAKTFERRAGSTPEAIEQLLDFAGLHHFESDRRPANAVNLLTLHAAKGLEFRHVYIAGLEERSLPNARAVNTGDEREMEEQRRLLYVGMTRAMERLTLTSAASRPGRSNLQMSRFIEEIPPHLRERSETSDP